MNIPLVVIALLLGYALGNFSPAYLLGRWIGGFDIREQGSGNAGATNVMRTLGWRYGVLVFTLDIIKGAAAAALGFWLAGNFGLAAAGIGVVLGHDYPAALGFRGGKGAATGVGGLLILWPWAVPLLVATWGVVLVSSGYVGLATVIGALSLPLWAWWFDAGPERMWFAVAMALFIAFTHRGNLQRLRQGTESRFERARLLYRLHGRSRY